VPAWGSFDFMRFGNIGIENKFDANKKHSDLIIVFRLFYYRFREMLLTL